jgi:hypothetical protein
VKRGVLLLVLLGVVAAPLGWVVSDEFESRDEFCISCHLDPDTPLHIEKFERSRSEVPGSLVAAHRAAPSQSDAEFRCIDCHRGASPANRLRVKTVAARDTVMWAIGAFDEPDRMEHPLWDEDCAQCHETYAPRRDDAFHAFRAHNVGSPYRCVECHLSHTNGGSVELSYLDRGTVLPLCRSCHKEF